MNLLDEKKVVYELMRDINSERQRLSKQYNELKKRLDQIDISILDKHSSRNTFQDKTKRINKEDIENDKYFLSKSENRYGLPYTKIAMLISHILKESDIPLSNRQIYEKIIDGSSISLNYSNLSNNILPRISSDSSINVEKVTRGYWQYKLRN